MTYESFVLWDSSNRHVRTFSGPHTLAKFSQTPDGCSIEYFDCNGTSRGMVTLDQVKSYAEGGDLFAPVLPMQCRHLQPGW